MERKSDSYEKEDNPSDNNEEYYTYDFANPSIFTISILKRFLEIPIAVKRGENYYDVVSQIPLTTSKEKAATIQIYKVNKAQKEVVLGIAEAIYLMPEEQKQAYTRLFQLEQERLTRETEKEEKRRRKILDAFHQKTGILLGYADYPQLYRYNIFGSKLNYQVAYRDIVRKGYYDVVSGMRLNDLANSYLAFDPSCISTYLGEISDKDEILKIAEEINNLSDEEKEEYIKTMKAEQAKQIANQNLSSEELLEYFGTLSRKIHDEQ